MQETPEGLLEITSALLESLAIILQRNIDALQNDHHPLLQHRIQQEIEHQKGLLQQMEEVKERLQNYLNAPEPDRDPDPALRQDEALRRQSYPLGGPLGVTMFGTEIGTEQIRLSTGAKTLVLAIEKIGVEDVRDLGLICRGVPLIDTTDHPGINQRKSGIYFIATSCSTPTKIRFLNIIADRLEVDLIADQF